MKWVVIAICLFFALININAQQTVTTGNLLRINFTKPEIDYSDTLWQWKNVSVPDGGTSETCLKGFCVGNTEYLVTLKMEISRALEERFNYLYNNTSKSSRQIIRMLNWIDPMIPFLYVKPLIEKVNNGTWVFSGFQRTAFYVRGDSLYEGVTKDSLKIVHNVGKVGDRYLLVMQGKRTYDYNLYLADLSKSPSVTLDNKVEVLGDRGPIRGLPIKTHFLVDSMYLYKNDGSNVLNLASISQKQIGLIKKIYPEGTNTSNVDSKKYFYNGQILYYIEDSVLYRETFDLNTLFFQNKTTILNLTGLKFTADTDSNYLAYYRSDSLFVYSIAKEKNVFANKINLSVELSPWSLDAPYIYYHQTKNETGIKQQENIPSEFSLSQNFPNPFNPETTISYKVQAASQVSLKVYDVIGREVATLVNEYKQPGVYSSTFSTLNSSFATGIYFYRLQAGNPSAGSGQGFVQTKKMILIK
jgi:hypothetical protein